MKPCTIKERIPPVRGLLPLHNAKGAAFDPVDIQRWMRLNRLAYMAEKVDLLVKGPVTSAVKDALEHAARLDLRVSLRTDCAVPPEDLAGLKDKGLFDVFLCPGEAGRANLDSWLDACHADGLPIRVQLLPPFRVEDAERAATRFADAEVVSVNIALFDAFEATRTYHDSLHGREMVAGMNALAAAVTASDIEVNIIGLPFCLVDDENLVFAENTAQFFMDHQQYQLDSHETATRLYGRGRNVARTALLMLLNRHTSFRNPIDTALFPWLWNHPWVHARAWALHKLTRSARAALGRVRPVDDSPEGLRERLDRFHESKHGAMDKECAGCAFRRICDHVSEGFKRTLPGLAVKAVDGQPHVSAMHFLKDQPKHYDKIDLARRNIDEDRRRLAEMATAIISDCPPAREITSFDYSVEGGAMLQMPGGLRWFSFTNTEKLSTVLDRLEPPFTIAYTVGEGVADYVGFSFGRHSKILCPMEAYSHRIALHVAADGRYVLMRDGDPMRPELLTGGQYVPTRLGGVLEPQIAIRNIDGSLITQTVHVWREDAAADRRASGVEFSVVVVCTRYSRRLQAALMSIAGQQGLDMGKIEVIVAYIPGLDATEDLMDAMEAAHPELRIVRSPFPRNNARSKGLMINESARMASGEWTILLDADIVLPADMFVRLGEVGDEVSFVAPEGRKLLTRDTTARILLGEIDPLAQWHELMDGPGEYRFREAFGVPIGYCQCVRTSCLDKVRYDEHEHFGGADYRFGEDVQRLFGPALRLDGVSVLHLDHGGSQWYGAQKQF